MGEKRRKIWGKEVAIVSVFSDNIQYKIKEPLKVLLITNKEKQLLKGEGAKCVHRKKSDNHHTGY